MFDKFKVIYERVFSLKEIENSKVLILVFWAQIFTFFFYFNSIIGSKASSVISSLKGTTICPPYFQNCEALAFLEPLPFGYSQSTFYMILFGVMVLISYFLLKKKFFEAHVLTLFLFIWKFLLTFFLSFSYIGNYEYYHLVFTAILLFFPYKIFFLQLSLPLFYFLSTLSKVHEAWILGTYFSSLKLGLPLFPKLFIPIATNALIFLEMIASWFLMSKNKILQRSTLIFFIFFHLYSGILVYYRYPATVLPTLLILFGPLYQRQDVPLSKKSIFAWSLIAFLVFAQISPKLIKGDEKLTLEGNYQGLYMFETNHQCISNWKIKGIDGGVLEHTDRADRARNRCDPYRDYLRIKKYCQLNTDKVSSVAWTFDHSINGNPFLRIVDEENACLLEYKAFSRNEWIKTKEDNPEIIGYPVENYYY